MLVNGSVRLAPLLAKVDQRTVQRGAITHGGVRLAPPFLGQGDAAKVQRGSITHNVCERS